MGETLTEPRVIIDPGSEAADRLAEHHRTILSDPQAALQGLLVYLDLPPGSQRPGSMWDTLSSREYVGDYDFDRTTLDRIGSDPRVRKLQAHGGNKFRAMRWGVWLERHIEHTRNLAKAALEASDPKAA